MGGRSTILMVLSQLCECLELSSWVKYKSACMSSIYCLIFLFRKGELFCAIAALLHEAYKLLSKF